MIRMYDAAVNITNEKPEHASTPWWKVNKIMRLWMSMRELLYT